MLQHAQVQAKIPPKALWEFCQKLAYDDSFRERLQNHPREVLNEYNLPVSDEYSFGAVTLPPKEEIAEAIQEVTAGREFVDRRVS